jgi:IclR family pca regulon transcriptional regulator
MAQGKRSLDRSFIGSLAHGLTVLEAVADSGQDIGLAELAQRVGFNKTSTWRLAHTLVELGYLEQDPQSRSFRPAARVLALGYGYFDGLDLKQHAQPYLHEMRQRHNETVNLAVRNGDELVYIERIGTTHIVAVNLHVGSRLPLYCTSLGRTLISEMPEEWLDQYVKRLNTSTEKRTDGPVSFRKLSRQLEETRARRYAINDEELVKGLRAISSPIRDRSGEIIAAICISVPSTRVTVAEMHRSLAPDLVASADKISAALGYRLEKSSEKTKSKAAAKSARSSR